MSIYSLPPEILTRILHYSSPVEQPTLLRVSHAFHEIAISLVFSSVKIYFVGGREAFSMLNTDHEDFKDDITTKLMTRSFELLRQMIMDPSFARIVRSITVITASDSESTFECLLLGDAIMSLPSLRTLRWLGVDPCFTDTIAESLPKDLERLTLKTYVPSTNLFGRFHSIAHLELPTPFYFPDDEEIHDDTGASSALLDVTAAIDFEAITSTMALGNLQSLTLNAVYLPTLPIKILETLKELDICITTVLQGVGLDLILRHAVVLESLTVFGYVDQAIFEWLACGSSDLPSLHSFRLSCDRFTMMQPIEGHNLELFLSFLRDRVRLRRLYLRIPSLDWSALTALAPEIRNLKALEVIGLHTGETIVDDWFIPFLRGTLPAKLKALYLGIDWNGLNFLPLAKLTVLDRQIDALNELHELAFVHLYGIRSRLPLTLQDFSPAKNVKLLGLNRALWDVVRGGTEVDFELRKWPRWKIKYCTEEDFEDEDYYWLFKYN
ncbi:hypothetical protein FA15DRAFT_656930 [Coprinopsis marcescibilis]|uniref:F-box domain-containing protein n=1 Tax=Coprinopsis marcescibilis TaxID=230819 RepID=A0A5C3KRT2_COPMA|nr:hypothetical protein FA15DRAFT_656930 [Coprinopsis marcescibilis]